MNKTILQLTWVFLAVLLICSSGSAYIPITKIQGVPFKFYSDTINEEECRLLVQDIGLTHFEGIKLIRIYAEPRSRHDLGTYFKVFKMVSIYEGCNKEVIIHELAHHCQYQRGDTLRQGRQHRGNFEECEDAIYNLQAKDL